MASPVEFAFSQSSSPRLPVIGDNTSLVSQPLVQTSREFRDVGEHGRASESPGNLEDEVVNREKRKLKKLICRAFITALHRNNEIKCWNHLCEVLELSEPYLSLLKTKELCHYAERAYIEIEGREDLENVALCLQSVFVDVIANLQKGDISGKRKSKFPSGPDEDDSLTPKKKAAGPKGIKIPRVDPKPFILSTDGKLLHHPKQAKEMSLHDLRYSLVEVIREISTRESVLGVPLGMTILALDVNFPQTHLPSPPQTPKTSMTVQPKQTVTDGMKRNAQPDLLDKRENAFIPKTGREIVEDFIKGNFLGELRFAYLNFASSKRYDPYDLIEVTKGSVNPEHFVISSHSIFHVTPNGPSETQTLSQWYIEASTFKAALNLAFFKNFLLRKMFQKLRYAKKYTYFRKTKSELEHSLIHNVPSFGSALLRISSLLNDLSKVTFLPFDANCCYGLNEFEERTFKTSDTGRMYLNKFFGYCQMIVDKTQDNCFEYLRYCEAQIKNHQHNYKESLAVAKEKQIIRQQNLKLAYEEVAKLGTFVNLVDHIIIQNLLTVAQTNICRFVDVTLPGPRPERDGLFKVDMVFDDSHKLILLPSIKHITYSLSAALHRVLTIACSMSHAMQLGELTKSFVDNAKKDKSTSKSTKTWNTANNAQDAQTGGVRFSPLIDQYYDDEWDVDAQSEPEVDSNSCGDCYSNLSNGREALENYTSTGQDLRSDEEIIDDIQDFNTSLESARGMKKRSFEELCTKRPQETILFVEGQKVEQHGTSHSPLTKEKLEQTLYNNEKIKDALKYHKEFVDEAMEEVKEFCDNHGWLLEIHEFVSVWDDVQMDFWKVQPTTKIEQQLHQIHAWTEQVGNVIQSFSTANGLLYINCIQIQEIIIPKLNNIFKQMVKMVASQVLVLSGEAIVEMEKLVGSVKEQRTEIKAFALFILQLKKVKERVPALKDKVEYIKNLFEVIRGCYRQLTAEEEVAEEKVWACWESFLFGLQEASDFIQIQKPMMIERLKETISNLEEEALGIGQRATSGRFIDPDEFPSSVLSDLRQLRERCRRICNELKDISIWREVISGASYDMATVLGVYESIEKRLELWRYFEVSSNGIKDWLQCPFRKVHVKRIMDKINEWESACKNLQAYIDEDDNVLIALMANLQEFGQELPLLLQLSSDALKPRHWRSLFIGMGQEFDPSMLFTTACLVSFNLGRYKDLISTICAGAAYEHALETELSQLLKAWCDRDFKLAKYIPFMRPRISDEQTRKSDKQKDKKRKMTIQEKAKVKIKPKTPASVPDVLILIGIGELKCMIEDNLVTLQSMLVSPYVVDVKPLVQHWISNLTELQDILDTWEDCQKKWLYLTNVFSEPNMAKKYADQLDGFSKIDKKYREFIGVIVKNTKVTLVLSKKRGELGWRELQGETLRLMLQGLIHAEEELINTVNEYFEQARMAFPRLYFLSDSALLDVLAWSRNPKDLLPFVQMCFPGIKNLQFKLPHDVSVNLTTALDAALNAHLLEVTAMEGNHDEQVSLIRPIPASPCPQNWLASLEQTMRDTLMNELAQCVRVRLGEGLTNYTRLVEQLVLPCSPTVENTVTSDDTSLLSFPAQCIDKAEDVLWTRKVNNALVSGKLHEFSNIRSEIKTIIADLASAIRKSIEWQDDSHLHKRMEIVLANLLTQAVNHRDTLAELIEDRVSSAHSFEWQSQLRSEIEITEEISSCYNGRQAGDDNISSGVPFERSYKIGSCSVEQLGTTSLYGYEYQGPITRLVVTPLAKRCFLTLNMALQAFKCGTLHGPNGTGKTETVQHLSQILGRHLVMVNCTPSLASPALVSYLSGMLRSGSWVCLENFDSMSSGVLSVFGQHLQKIWSSVKSIKRDLYSQYTVRGDTEKNRKELERRNSLVSLGPLYGDKSAWPKEEIQQDLQKRRRRLSASEADKCPDPPSLAMTEPLSEWSRTLEKTFQDKNGLYRDKATPPLSFNVSLLGNIVFNNSLLGVSSMYGCFMTMSSYKSSYSQVPENLKVLLRPVAMVVPDVLTVLEVTMSCCGFTEGKSLAKKLHTFFKMISDQMSKQTQNDFSLRSMRTVVQFASYQLRKELKRKAYNAGSSSEQNTEAPIRSPFLESFERRQTEENALVHGLFSVFGNKLLASDKEFFSITVDTVFIHSVLMSIVSEGEPVLSDEIKEYFISHGLQIRTELIAKAVQLYKSVKSSRNVIVFGSSGSGKTTLYQALTGAVNNLHAQSTVSVPKRRKANRTTDTDRQTPDRQSPSTDQKTWPMLDVTVVFPKSLTNDELFGHRDPTTTAWRDGLISKFFRDSTLTSRMKKEFLTMTSEEKQRTFRGMRDLSVVEKWLVLDGPMDDLWLGSMSTVLDNTKSLSLGDGGSIAVPDTVSIVFETTNLSNVSPSLVTCCSIVHCPDNLVGWKAIFRSWSKCAHSKWDISSRGLGIISCLMDHVVETTLIFLKNHCKSILTADYGSIVPPSSPARGIHEIQSLLRYLSAMFDRYILREDDDRQEQMIQQQKGRVSGAGSVHSRQSSGISAGDTDKVVSTFAFAFVWAFGGHLQDRFAKSFDEHARQLLSSGPYPANIPAEGLVYDYYIDFLKGNLVRWEERPAAQFKTFASSYTVVPEIDRYFFLMDLMISARQPVVLVGEPGTGKSALVQNLISPRHSYHRIFMSAGMSSKLFQEAIEAKLTQIKRRDLKEVPVQPSASDMRHMSDMKSKPILYFLDDLNYANVDKSDVQPPVELLRQILSQGCLFNKDRQQYYPVKNIQVISTAVPPSATGVGGGVASHALSPGLIRLMTVLSFFPASTETLTAIYSGIFRAWLKGFPAYSITHHAAISEAMASATVQLYNKIREELRPSPFHPELIFSQHDLARIAQSMTLFSTSSRGRPRPRLRKRGGGAGDAGKETKSFADRRGATKSIIKQMNQKNEKSVPTDQEDDSRTTVMTPALLSPIIRTLFRLWCHENTRTYCDRLLDDDQRYWFGSLLNDHVMEHFCKGVESAVVEVQPEVKRLFPESNWSLHGPTQRSLLLNVLVSLPVLLAPVVSPQFCSSEMSQESIGLAPGTNAPPPSAKVSRCSDFHDKPVQKVEVESGAQVAERDAIESSESENKDVQDVEVETSENVNTEDNVEKEEREGKLEIPHETSEVDNVERANDEVHVTNVGDEVERADDDDVIDEAERVDAVDVADEAATSEQSASSVEPRLDEEQIGQAACTFSAQPPRNKVTFGISIDEDKQDFKGPLITLDQLASPGEDLTDIVFCKHLNATSLLVTARSTASDVRGYIECSNQSLEQGMQKFLASYNSQTSQESSFKKINMVTFREALCHSARISRALATEGGHALLLSHQGYGRRTLTRLVAHAAGFKLIEVQNTPFLSQGDLRQQIKEASYIAGLQGKPVVLFVPEDQRDQSLQDICTLMVEGTCPGLYTMNELNMISSHLLPVGQRGAWRTEHQDIAQERFFRRVKSHLHVVVCLKHLPLTTSHSSSQSQLYRFPILLSRCFCVDLYLPWPHEALASIAEKLIDVESSEFNLVPWKRGGKDAQTSAICSIMAHVHLSSRCMAQKLYGVKGLKLYSPDSYLDFVHLFKKLCERLCVNEKAKISRLKNGIIRMEEANDTIENMNSELAELAPLCEEAHNAVKQCHEAVEAGQKEYQDQKEACKQQEIEIEALQGPVQMLKKETSEEFGKVSPLFEAACYAINALNIHDVEEIRSYRVPPLLVELVVKSICLLFHKEQTWNEGKILLHRDNFFKDLEFYDMKRMPDSMFVKLKDYYNDPSFQPGIVKAGSFAAGSLCLWVRAVYDYCVVFRALKPKRRRLKNAEGSLENGKKVLGELRVRCNEIKKELEEKIQQYKDSVKHLKNTEKKIQTIEGRKSRALNLFNSIAEYYETWKNTLTKAQQNLATSPGDALIAAASVCYLGALNQDARDELFSDWLRVCDGTKRELSSKRPSLASMILKNPDIPSAHLEDVKPSQSRKTALSSTVSSSTVPVRENVSLASLLAEKDELAEWAKKDLPSNEHALQNAVIMRTCYDRTHCWPLLIDPHGQAEMWVRAITEVKPLSSTDITTRCKSRASSTRASTPLDYQEIQAQDEDVSLRGDISDKDSACSDVDDQSIFDGRDTPTDQSTDVSDKTFKERIAKEMGIQTPDVPSISTATPNLEVDEGQVMVIPADDSQIVSKVRAAVVSGVVVLITHMERRRFSKKLELLLTRQTFSDDQNTANIVIGKYTVAYHPSFRLFLSSSVPLYMPGEGLVPLSLSKTCVVDMSLSQEGLTDRLLRETLTLERPEYEGHQRSLERDLTLHQQQILTAQVFVLDKVLELNTALLKDANMLSNVRKSQDVIKTAGDRKDEAQTMKKQVQEKRDDFLPVARYGAMLYMIICQMHKVQPLYYHITLDSFLRLYRETILNRKRNKKSLGSPAARAAELISALSRMIYTRISWGLFLGDNLLFPFLISVEKLLKEGGITEDEWKLFIFRPPLPKGLTTRDKDPDKPSWITQQAWLFIDYLELLPNLKSLRTSLVDYCDEWREYFLLPPVLLANTPGDLPPLTVFQKALLWKIFREDQMHQICQDLVLYIMGATMVHPVEYDIHQVYSVSNNATPIVLLLPSHEALANGASISIKDPYDEILNLAQSHNKSTCIITVSLGESSSMVRALDEVRRGMDCGYWVVINNAHLAHEWPRDFIETLQVITSSTPEMEDSDEDEVYSVFTEDPDLRGSQSQAPSVVHPDFRLFITTRVVSGKPLPAVLIQRGLKLACESKTACRSTMRQSFEVEACNIKSWSSYWKEPFNGRNTIKSTVPQYALYTLAYLHSILHHRRLYGSSSFSCPYEWSDVDLHGSGDVLRHLSRCCLLDYTDSKPKTLKTLLDVLACTVYTGHVIDKLDIAAVRSLAQSLQNSKELEKMIDSSDSQSVEEKLEYFPESLSIDQLGVVQVSATEDCLQRSRALGVALQTSMELKAPQFSLDEVVNKLNQVKDIIDGLSSNMTVPEPSESPTAVASFFLKESLYYHEFLREITKDLHLLSKVIEGHIANTPYLHTLMVDLYYSRVPHRWYNVCGGPVSLAWWLESLSSSVLSVQEYSINVPPAVRLGSLINQQAYLSSVVIDYVKSHTVAPHSMVFEMQVMPLLFDPNTSPESGIYISGLYVQNASWDYERCCLTGGPEHVTELPIVLLTLQAPKQKPTAKSDLIVYNCPLITRQEATNDRDELVTSLSVFSALTVEELQKRKVTIVSCSLY